MSLDLGELVGTLRMDATQLDVGLEHGKTALRAFGSEGETLAGQAGQRIAEAAARPLQDGGTAAGSAFAMDAVDALAGVGAQFEQVFAGLPLNAQGVVSETSAEFRALSPAMRSAVLDAKAEAAAGLGQIPAAAGDAGRAAGVALHDGIDADGVGRQSADEFSSQFAETAKDVGKVAGAAIGTAIAVGVVDNLSVEAGVNKLATQLNLTSADAAIAGRTAASIYRNNFGEDLAQVNEAVRLVVTNIGTELGSVDIEPITQKVLTLADAFDQDLGMTTAAVGQLMKTGMAKDATEALDIITRGLQSPANKADDLLETFNEYGTQFRKLGLDGPTALGLLSQGLAGGARDADVVADAMKEFSIKTLEALSTTDSKGREQLTALGQAFVTLGLDGQKMQDDIAAGGPGATAALGSVLDKLRGVEDPATRAQAAVALFGTQAEDLGDSLYSLDVGTAADSLGTVGGAAQDAVDKMGSGGQATIETYKRQLLGLGQDAIESVGPLAAVAGAVAAFGPAVLGVLGPIATLVAARATQTAAAAAGATAETAAATATKVGWISSAATALSSAASMALAWLIAVGPALLVIAVIAGIVFLVIKYWDDIKAATGAAWDWVSGKVSGAVTWVVGFVKGNWPLLLGIITGPIGLAVALVAKYWDNIKDAAGSAWNNIKSTVANGAQGIVDGVQAIPGKLKELGTKFKAAGGDLIGKLLDGLGASAGFVGDFAQDVWEAVKSAINGGIDKLNGLLEFKIKIPGAPDISVNAPNIGHLAKGTGNWRGGPTWVGEEGPEILNLPQGSTVTPNNRLGSLGGNADDLAARLDMLLMAHRELAAEISAVVDRPITLSVDRIQAGTIYQAGQNASSGRLG